MSTLQLHGVRMWVTEGCNASCHFCMNAKGRSHAQVELDKFQKLCLYFRQNGFDRIAIMGGEPTIHPDFIKIMDYAQEYFPTVYLFTNAIFYSYITVQTSEGWFSCENHLTCFTLSQGCN